MVADILGAADDDLVAENEFLEFVEKLRETIDNLFCSRQPLSLASTRQPPKRM